MAYEFSDTHAKRLLERHAIATTELLPMYLELRNELQGGSINVDVRTPGVPYNVHAGYIRKFASLAAVYHELARSDTLQLPMVVPGKDEVVLKSATITRRMPKRDCRRMAHSYEDVIKGLQEDQRRCIEALLRE